MSYFVCTKIETEHVKPLYIGQEMLYIEQFFPDTAQRGIGNTQIRGDLL